MIDFKKIPEFIENNDNKALEEVFEIMRRSLTNDFKTQSYKFEDCMQQAFLKTYQKYKENLIESEAFYQYMYRSAYNAYINVAKSKKEIPLEIQKYKLEADVIDLSFDGEEETYDVLYEAIEKLSEYYKEIVYHFIRNPNDEVKEACKSFDVTYGAFRIAKSRAFSQLKEEIEKIKASKKQETQNFMNMKRQEAILSNIHKIGRLFSAGKISAKELQSQFEQLQSEYKSLHNETHS